MVEAYRIKQGACEHVISCNWGVTTRILEILEGFGVLDNPDLQREASEIRRLHDLLRPAEFHHKTRLPCLISYYMYTFLIFVLYVFLYFIICMTLSYEINNHSFKFLQDHHGHRDLPHRPRQRAIRPQLSNLRQRAFGVNYLTLVHVSTVKWTNLTL